MRSVKVLLTLSFDYVWATTSPHWIIEHIKWYKPTVTAESKISSFFFPHDVPVFSQSSAIPPFLGVFYLKASPLIHICGVGQCYAKKNQLREWDKVSGIHQMSSSSQRRAEGGSVHERPRWWMKPGLGWRVWTVKMEGTEEKGRNQ